MECRGCCLKIFPFDVSFAGQTISVIAENGLYLLFVELQELLQHDLNSIKNMLSTGSKHERGISPEVRVLCFGPSTQCDVMCERVRALGYVLRVITAAIWCQDDQRPLSGPTILFLGSRDPPTQLLLSALRETDAPASLLVFGSGCAWDEEMAGLCTDFLSWPCHEQELILRLTNVFASRHANTESLAAPSVTDEYLALKILGESPPLQAALRSIRTFAACDAPVLIEGETGTGKELASRAIHYFSARRDRPFIPITCGAMPDNLLENELFGHEKGAYTDAKARQVGLVAQAQGGTLFLDEVDTLSPKIQAAILRFLETREYRPLGSGLTKHADVRIIAATNVDLEGLVSRGQFRRDLFFRLNVLSVRLPPLAARSSDVRLLAEHFVREYSRLYGKSVRTIHPETINWMERYPWPGNIRELQNLIHRECLLASGPILRINDRTSSADGREGEDCLVHDPGTFRSAKANAIQSFEKHYLRWVMAESGGNVSKAARKAGKERRSLGKLLRKHGIGNATNSATKL